MRRRPAPPLFAAASARLTALAIESGLPLEIFRRRASLAESRMNQYRYPSLPLFRRGPGEAACWIAACSVSTMREVWREVEKRLAAPVSPDEARTRCELAKRENALKESAKMTRYGWDVLGDFYLETGRGHAWRLELRPGDEVLVLDTEAPHPLRVKVFSVDAVKPRVINVAGRQFWGLSDGAHLHLLPIKGFDRFDVRGNGIDDDRAAIQAEIDQTGGFTLPRDSVRDRRRRTSTFMRRV